MEPSAPEPHQTASIAKGSGLTIVLWLVVILFAAFIMGGGGVRYGLSNLSVQLVALGVLGFHRHAFLEFWRTAPLALRGLALGTVLLPLAQLISLPPSVWSILPGRDLVVQSWAAAGVTGWAPTSLDSARTLVALSGLIVPFTILTVGWAAPRRHLLTVAWFVVLLGLVCFVIGFPQILSGGEAFVFYEERSPAAIITGLFANRNSTGIFLVSALAFAALLPLPLARPHPAALPVRLGICALLVVGVVLTQSRTALVLCAIPLGLGAARAFSFWRRSQGAGSRRPAAALLGTLALGAVAIGGVFTMAPGRLGDTLERFDNLSDARAYLWDDAVYSAEKYWPVGAGMGTFDEVFQVDESLENLGEMRAGRAHNDFIELGIEAGAVGLAIALVWLAVVGWLSWRARRSQFRWAAWAGSGILLAVALQSITDYPLRNQTMLAVAAFALLLLARIGGAERQELAQ